MAIEQEVGLTIAGFDPSSGAGVTADVLTFAAHGVFAVSAITALTVQSTRGVEAVHPVEAEVLRRTLRCLEEDLPPAGIKIGMLGSGAAVQVVAEYVAEVRARRRVVVVLDPVLRASSGASLLDDAAAMESLLAMVDAVTPNLSEAAALTGLPCTSQAEMERCTVALRARFPALTVMLTGGHLERPADLVLGDAGLHWMEGEYIATMSTHGTGCAFSTALVAARMRGATWGEAAVGAKRFVARALRAAVARGQGCGPMALLPQLGRGGSSFACESASR